MKRALIVVDMLRGFLEKKYPLYCGKQSKAIIPFVLDKIMEYNRSGGKVIFLADNHDPNDLEFDVFPPHCVKGTEETEILPELLNAAGDKVVIPKTRFSGFYGTNLNKVLGDFGPREVEVVGVCTNICVYFTVQDLRNRDYFTRVYSAGVASFDQEGHDFALKQMKEVLGVEVV